MKHRLFRTSAIVFFILLFSLLTACDTSFYQFESNVRANVSDDVESMVSSEPESSKSESSKSESSKKESTTREITVTSDLVFTAGSYATVSIKGKPNTEYSITVTYKSGRSKAEGLKPKVSDSKGNVSWTWKIGINTTPGNYSITISGGGKTIYRSFTVK